MRDREPRVRKPRVWANQGILAMPAVNRLTVAEEASRVVLVWLETGSVLDARRPSPIAGRAAKGENGRT